MEGVNMLKRIPWQDVCKFLAGAFFVSAGVLFYLYVYRVSVPIFSTGFMETPGISGARSIAHAVFFVLFFYLGFLRKWKSRSTNGTA
jgi:energy-converting hydrogenase Eha subunit G